ncbi:MAG TPA: MucB/RseB C-terminal domain-containing protein [Burkholderiales bacterium]|nr:MucB/RseB C-terminal domain-containing protein [Burkholderiales bacterium]
MKKVWLFVVFGPLAANVALADNGNSQEGFALLQKMANASRHLNYSGTFVYQHTNSSETSRIVHYVNSAGGEFEKLEVLDGPAREVIRSNDQLTCYLPKSKTVIIEQRNARQLPVLLPERMTGILENYTVKKMETDRVADYDCNVIMLEPKDNMRYGRSFCAEVNSGLPLRSRTIGEKGEVLESFAFTQLAIGGAFNRDKVKSKYAAKSRGWHVDRSALNASEKVTDTDWIIKNQPPGFKKLTEIKRSIAGRAGVVSHIVFSDGLAAVSIFIEPMPKERPAQTLFRQGAVNIYTRSYADQMVTVLGEAPAATIMQFANSLEQRAGAAK